MIFVFSMLLQTASDACSLSINFEEFYKGLKLVLCHISDSDTFCLIGVGTLKSMTPVSYM